MFIEQVIFSHKEILKIDVYLQMIEMGEHLDISVVARQLGEAYQPIYKIYREILLDIDRIQSESGHIPDVVTYKQWLYTHNLVYLYFKQSFTNTEFQLEQFLKHADISYSTLRRHLKPLMDLIDNFGLSLRITTGQIQGCEMNAQILYNLLFYLIPNLDGPMMSPSFINAWLAQILAHPADEIAANHEIENYRLALKIMLHRSQQGMIGKIPVAVQVKTTSFTIQLAETLNIPLAQADRLYAESEQMLLLSPFFILQSYAINPQRVQTRERQAGHTLYLSGESIDARSWRMERGLHLLFQSCLNFIVLNRELPFLSEFYNFATLDTTPISRPDLRNSFILNLRPRLDAVGRYQDVARLKRLIDEVFAVFQGKALRMSVLLLPGVPESVFHKLVQELGNVVDVRYLNPFDRNPANVPGVLSVIVYNQRTPLVDQLEQSGFMTSVWMYEISDYQNFQRLVQAGLTQRGANNASTPPNRY
ncbi:helix-turn-helix domain-containing protein [Lacticaseibacillus brantae]|uniref:Mga helix-turn-helix domain-containing protein n=1 Tax=Lacticaseibacillus brantae DSM 23927 TaxID=1423727 RepID=A0A0R2AYW9_9LACO|nr:helix-turn-helix domain-containing protein [Lacticaseibacillus brantae]KRM71730.1 hypothetical protein FC34_GL001389 [Lacticaseibacillus brantae DSM 23927]